VAVVVVADLLAVVAEATLEVAGGVVFVLLVGGPRQGARRRGRVPGALPGHLAKRVVGEQQAIEAGTGAVMGTCPPGLGAPADAVVDEGGDDARGIGGAGDLVVRAPTGGPDPVA